MVLLEKENRIGGNSAKASSGINALDFTNKTTEERQRMQDIYLVDCFLSYLGLEEKQMVDLLNRFQLSGPPVDRVIL